MEVLDKSVHSYFSQLKNWEGGGEGRDEKRDSRASLLATRAPLGKARRDSGAGARFPRACRAEKLE